MVSNKNKEKKMNRKYSIYDSEIKAIQKIIAFFESQGMHLTSYTRKGYEGGDLELWVDFEGKGPIKGWDIEHTYLLPYKNLYKKDFEFSFGECELIRVQQNKREAA